MKRSMTADSNVTRQQIADAFRAAKRRLWNGSTASSFGKEAYICHALSTTDAGLAAQRIIMQRLGGRDRFFSLDAWLRHRGFVSGFDMPNYDRIVQDYRHRWLDALIEEFSS